MLPRRPPSRSRRRAARDRHPSSRFSPRATIEIDQQVGEFSSSLSLSLSISLSFSHTCQATCGRPRALFKGRAAVAAAVAAAAAAVAVAVDDDVFSFPASRPSPVCRRACSSTASLFRRVAYTERTLGEKRSERSRTARGLIIRRAGPLLPVAVPESRRAQCDLKGSICQQVDEGESARDTVDAADSRSACGVSLRFPSRVAYPRLAYRIALACVRSPFRSRVNSFYCRLIKARARARSLSTLSVSTGFFFLSPLPRPPRGRYFLSGT